MKRAYLFETTNTHRRIFKATDSDGRDSGDHYHFAYNMF